MSGNESLIRLAGQIRDMSWDELRTRARQEVAKRKDLVLTRFGANLLPDQHLSHPEFCGHFFFESADVRSILHLLRRRFPNVVGSIVYQAEQICEHRFHLLGYRDVDYGPRIDWHLDAVHGKHAPRRAWYKVPYLDFKQVGDSKITWELNRHQHLVTLAKAYRLTGRPQYALEVFRQWYDWQEQNPYPIGINWASSLEVAFRSLSWLWVRQLLEGCAIVPAGFASDLRRALMISGRHIARFPSTYFSPNTHLLGEGVGLFFIGTLCPGSTAKTWQRLGWQMVLREAQRQVWSDGMHFEGSAYYHTYALDFFLHARVLASLNGIPIPAEFDKTIERMLEVLLCLGRAGSLPRLGDDDGGRVFDPRRNRSEYLLDPLALGALLFNRGDFKIAAGDLTEETVWLSGVERAVQFDGLRGETKTPASFALKPSGIHVMSSAGLDRQQLVINAGPTQPGRRGHRHADLLSIQIAINGQEILIDPGTYAYVGEDGERDQFRGTAAHNSVQVDGLEQGEPGGPFEWRFLSPAEVSRWTTGNTFDFFEGRHGGYRRLPDPVEHQRSIFYLKPRFWLVRDIMSGAKAHEIGVQWHFSPGFLTKSGEGFTFVSDNRPTLGLMFASNQPWSCHMNRHWYSREYGARESVPLLRLTTEGPLPLELVTLLAPVSTATGHLGVFTPFVAESSEAAVRAYSFAPTAGTAKHLFVFAAAPGGWSLGPWSSDARFFLCTSDHQGRIEAFVLCDGSFLAFDGKQLTVASECLRYAEFFFDGDRPLFRCSNEDAVRMNPLMTAEVFSRPDALATV